MVLETESIIFYYEQFRKIPLFGFEIIGAQDCLGLGSCQFDPKNSGNAIYPKLENSPTKVSKVLRSNK
jgi:hypothetical protein